MQKQCTMKKQSIQCKHSAAVPCVLVSLLIHDYKEQNICYCCLDRAIYLSDMMNAAEVMMGKLPSFIIVYLN